MDSRTDLMGGTLDLLILRSLLATPLHGLGIARRIGQITHGSFDVKAGSLFPTLYRLEERGLVKGVITRQTMSLTRNAEKIPRVKMTTGSR